MGIIYLYIYIYVYTQTHILHTVKLYWIFSTHVGPQMWFMSISLFTFSKHSRNFKINKQ